MKKIIILNVAAISIRGAIGIHEQALLSKAFLCDVQVSKET